MNYVLFRCQFELGNSHHQLKNLKSEVHKSNFQNLKRFSLILEIEFDAPHFYQAMRIRSQICASFKNTSKKKNFF